jgi:bifunctional DNA-binding transcriptional regulator/antitoxin component of YhaV-PrlF toxin-antitoxin module
MMAMRSSSQALLEQAVTGFGVVDAKGRFSLSKQVREALGIEPGAALAYVVVDNTLLLIPQDAHVAALLEHAARVVEEAGLTAQDFLDELPAVRAQVVRKLYGEEFMNDLERHYGAIVGSELELGNTDSGDES